MKRWQIFSAVALRRLPELMPPKDSIELEVQNIFDKAEQANSRYSNHEMQNLEDIRLKESQELDVIIKETAQDKEDRWNKERSEFKFGTYDEKLSKIHYLFLKTKFGTDIKDQWLLPQAKFDREIGDKNLLDTARRALKDSLDIVNGFRIVSKVPAASCKFKYPKKVINSTGYEGAIVFFLKAHLDLPSASVLKAVDESNEKNQGKLKWLTKKEATKLVDSYYMCKFSNGLLHEDRVDVNEVLRKASAYAKTMKVRVSQ